MDRGFYHPERGYWQTVGGDPVLFDYPDGTYEVPLQPSEHHSWDGTDWVYVEPALEPIIPEQVDVERDRRTVEGFYFGGIKYQSSPEDRENISGASLAALGAIIAGSQVGDYRWHGGASDFEWIAADNSTHKMDAITMFSFGQIAMAHKQALIFAARVIKDMVPVPQNYTDDQYWPQ